MEAVHGGSARRVWPHETIENLLNKSHTQAIMIIFDVLLKVEGLYRADPGFEEGVVTFQFSCHLDLRSRVASYPGSRIKGVGGKESLVRTVCACRLKFQHQCSIICCTDEC